MKSYISGIIILFTAVFLTACSFTPKDIGRSDMFALRPVKVIASNKYNKTLSVSLPVAAPELDTYRIAIINDNKRWDYYAGSRWVDFIPLLVQDSIIKTLGESGLFNRVSSDEAGLLSDDVLKIEIRSFQAEYKNKGEPPVIHIALSVNINNRIDNRFIKGFNVSRSLKLKEDRISVIQEGFSDVFKKIQEDIVYKLASSTR